MRLSVYSEEDYNEHILDEKERKARAAKDNALVYFTIFLILAFIAWYFQSPLLTSLFEVVGGILIFICCGYGMIAYIIENAGEQ